MTRAKTSSTADERAAAERKAAADRRAEADKQTDPKTVARQGRTAEEKAADDKAAIKASDEAAAIKDAVTGPFPTNDAAPAEYHPIAPDILPGTLVAEAEAARRAPDPEGHAPKGTVFVTFRGLKRGPGDPVSITVIVPDDRSADSDIITSGHTYTLHRNTPFAVDSEDVAWLTGHDVYDIVKGKD